MNADQTSLHEWISEEVVTHLKSAFEGFIGESPKIESSVVPEVPADATFRWRQPFSGIPGALWITGTEAACIAAGGCLARAVGLPEDDPAGLKSEFLEIAKQALSGTAQAMGGRLGREIVCEGGAETDAPADETAWVSLTITIGETVIDLFTGAEGDLLKALEETKAAPDEPEPESAELMMTPGTSHTFEMLLDVELPVSVSFGRAQVALKDVLKLTSGSIVELNRAVADPVEVVVNNCVIARGEVVTVDGNFGVRIQHVVSRQERWRTVK